MPISSLNNTADVYGTKRALALKGGTKAAVFYHDIPASRNTAMDEIHALQDLGVQVVYTAQVQPTEPDYTGHVVQMRAKGVDFVYATIQESEAARLARAMTAQGMTGTRWLTTAYSDDWFDLAGPAADGTFNQINNVPFEEADQYPGMKDYIDTVHHYFPGSHVSFWGLYGWSSALMFADAITASGPHVTRTGVVDYLRNLHQFDAHGALGVSDPAGKKWTDCSIYVEAKGGKWNRVYPTQGFDCSTEPRQPF
jgi:ABC-type branched-subunit amino acid transport system substrate-binding protein